MEKALINPRTLSQLKNKNASKKNQPTKKHTCFFVPRSFFGKQLNKKNRGNRTKVYYINSTTNSSIKKISACNEKLRMDPPNPDSHVPGFHLN